jgi:hypothetical protein
VVLAQANERGARSSASGLVLRRFGGRVWASVVLALALVITLGLLGPSTPSSMWHPGPGNSSQSNALALGGRDTNLPGDAFTSADNRPIVLPDPEDLNSSNSGQDQSSQAAKGSAKSTDALPTDAHAAAAPGNEGLGNGSAKTHPPADAVKAQLANGHGGTSSASSEKTAVQANGAGMATGDKKAGNAPAGGLMAGSGSQSATPPPWKGSDWPSDIQQAQIALDAGRIPDAYRDLVRGYFTAE